ncbi:PREDICTED: kinesin-like protein KIF23 [Cyphomyrmex costatus]|uniref:kinesin-like protein KIF23 n=1 Tax=Cyphomyrmex costatus TaxID=456900 RepID=UPI0008523C7D|nr:PREDICTED: kinesin-like protein KIF23 [Cyphomyrmex costatus]
MKSARSKTPARKPISRLKGSNMVSKDPVQVYCRLRPMQSPTDVSCMRIASDMMTIVITPPESAANFRTIINKEIQTTFSHVFMSHVTQREIFKTVALPLVKNLIHGRNGLLFTYGVTGSGKTYTMTGESQDTGIMPRCLDVIFNTIANYQTKKFVFKPDKLNGFDVQSQTDAMLDRQHELHAGLSHRGRFDNKYRKIDSDGDSNPIMAHERNESQNVSVEPDNAYAVFVTYVEIYNNSVYDLLDEDDIRTKTLQSKIVREDGNKNMYVHAVTEIEVKSAEEAFELFQRGQRKRRVAHTALNAESSRSHSVFTIRLVQAPLDGEGEQVIQDKRVVCVSQLSLVDLAGSERTNRTKNTGQRLREAGNINNSLMTLRSCLEILRENQSQGTNKIVPYRDSKLTHLFKNYFDGEGQVRMIVCINPRADDYDETIQVMKFAEMTQEVHIARSNPVKLDLGFTPGRRQANKIFKEARSKLEKEGRPEAADLNIDLGLVYSLGGSFPQLETVASDNDQIIQSLIQYLEQRINKRNILRADLHKKQEDFRRTLMGIEQENVNLKIEVASLRAASTQQKRKISALEGHVCKSETQIDVLLCKLNSANERIQILEQELKDRDLALNQRLIDKQRVKQRYNTKIQVETDKLNKEFEMRLRQQREHLQNQVKKKDDKLRLVQQIIVDENDINPTIASKKHQVSELTTRVVSPDRDTRVARKDRIPISNPRYRRSQSADRWIDHRPQTLVPVGTVLQPMMQRRRSVTQLTSPKEITDGASRYCLVAQEHDTDGELETKLYKGDILPTSGGGAQVVFNDMECLKQSSPKARKRTGPDEEGLDQVDISTLTEMKRPRV